MCNNACRVSHAASRAYGPGEFKILTSVDGGNFEEAACWRKPSRPEVSYEDVVLFEAPRHVKALTILMRSPMPWGYFGLNEVALLVEPGPIMLVSGLSVQEGELCLVSQGGSLSVNDCLGAIAAGTGKEIFQFNEASQLESVVGGKCVSLASGDAVGGGRFVMQDCAAAEEAGDGRSNFELTPAGQLRLSHMANYCVVADLAGTRAQDCGAAEKDGTAQGVFFQAPVPDFDGRSVSLAQGISEVLSAAVKRQAALLAQLQDSMRTLGTCALAFGSNTTHARQFVSLAGAASRLSVVQRGDAAMQSIAKIDRALGVDMSAIKTLISDSAATLAAATSKAMRTV